MFKLISLLTVLVFIAAGAATIISSQGNSSSKQTDATPIQVGVMSEKQKQHSKLFESGFYKTGRKLDTPRPGASNNPDSEDGPYIGPPFEVLNPNAPAMSFNEFLMQMGCDSDAVVVVDIRDKTSQLTENREFIFTDYTASVKEVLRNNQTAPLAADSSIVITRPGGKVKIKDRVVSALDSSFQPLVINNTYLLFLKYVPATGAYQAVRKGSFLLQNGVLTKLTEEVVPGSNGQTLSFTNDSRNSIQNCSR